MKKSVNLSPVESLNSKSWLIEEITKILHQSALMEHRKSIIRGLKRKAKINQQNGK